MARRTFKHQGHKSRTVLKNNRKTRRSRKHQNTLKSKRKPNKQHLKNLRKDALLSKKLFNNMIIEHSRTKGPTYNNAMKLLTLGKKAYKKGDYKKAMLYNTMASAYFLSFNPSAPPVIERGRLGEPRTGLHAVVDPDTMVKYGTMPPIVELSKLSRSERRRTARKGRGRRKHKRKTKRR